MIRLKKSAKRGNTDELKLGKTNQKPKKKPYYQSLNPVKGGLGCDNSKENLGVKEKNQGN